MNKENMIDIIDETIAKENQLFLDLPQKSDVAPLLDEYQGLLKDLILMALPGPSEQIH